MKKSAVLLIVLAALVGVAVLKEKGNVTRTSTASRSGVPMRELLLPDLDTKDIRTIRVREGDKHANIKLVDGRWTVLERGGYPASYDKVERAVRSISEMKIKGKTEV